MVPGGGGECLMTRCPRSEALVGNALFRSSASSVVTAAKLARCQCKPKFAMPLKQFAKRSFERGVPKQSLGRRDTGETWRSPLRPSLDRGDESQELGFQQGQLLADRVLEIGEPVCGRIGPHGIAGGDRPQVLTIRPRTRFDQKERQRPGFGVGVEYRSLENLVVGQ